MKRIFFVVEVLTIVGLLILEILQQIKAGIFHWGTIAIIILLFVACWCLLYQIVTIFVNKKYKTVVVKEGRIRNILLFVTISCMFVCSILIYIFTY